MSEVTDAVKAADGLQNVISGLGGAMDKTSYNVWNRSLANQDKDDLITRFREDWASQKICTIPALDSTRRWRDFCDDKDAKEADEYFNVQSLFYNATKWARVYGTSAILLDLKKAGRIETPLDLDRLKPGCIKSLQVIDRTRLAGTGWIDPDPLSPSYGQPEFYMIAGSSARIHNSRFIRFEGTELPMYENWHNQWYSDSVLIPLREMIDNFNTAMKSSAQLASEANVDVITVNGLQNQLTNPQGEAAVMRRFRMMKQLKSVYNVILLDSNETYEMKRVGFSGLNELMWKYLEILAAAVGIPATRFLSTSPTGMNATGESDMNNYIEMLEAIQSMVFKPRLKKLDTIIQKHFGLPAWKYKWNSLFPETDQERDKREKDVVESISTLVEKGIITPQAAHNVLISKNIYSKEILQTPPTEPAPGAASISRPSEGAKPNT